MAGPWPLPSYILLGGQRSPGIARVTGLSSPRNWQEQQGFGTDGASLRYMGAGLPKFDVTLTMFTLEDRIAWEAWKFLVNKTKPGLPPPSYDISHPLCQDCEISKVVVVDRTQLEEKSPGLWEVKITFQSYKKPRPIVTKPLSIESADGGAVPPATQLEKDIVAADKAMQDAAAGNGTLF